MSRYFWFGYVAWAVLLSTLYLLVPAVGLIPYAGIVAASVAAIFWGIHRNKPRKRLPWVLLAVSNLAFAVGTVTAYVLSDVANERAFPSAADIVFLGISTPTLIAALLLLTRSGARIRDRASRIDALILTVGAGFLSWVFLINPNLQNPELGWLEKTLSVLYPLSDILILAILARLAIGARRSRSAVLLLIAGSALLIADVLYGLSQLNGDWQLGGPVDVAWATFLLVSGAAALHPTMVELTEPQVVLRPTEVTLRRTILVIASLVAPAVLLIESIRGPVRDGVIIAIGAAALVLLVIARISAVATGLRLTTSRERELRRTGQALAYATDNERVQRVVTAAVADLLPAETPHRAILVIHDADLPEVGDGAVKMRYTRTLSPETAAHLAGFELTLQCPVTLATRRVGDLYVAAAEIALVELQEAAQLLAGQAAAMLGNLALHREINRRDSDSYFRTLVLNATDVIAIINAEERVTYASPSAQPLFGSDSMVGRNVFDLVAPSMRERAVRAMRRVRAGQIQQRVADWRVVRANGEEAEVEVAIRDLRDESTVAGLVLTLRDVTEQRRLQRELMSRAYVDPLTGLGNRLRFHDSARQAVDSSDGNGAVAGVVLVNIDDFRSVNDTMGHAVGDELLVAIGERLTATFGGAGTVARLGADEFGVVLDTMGDPADVAERVLAEFTAPFLVSGSALSVQPRVGVALADAAADPEQLLSQADVALNSAKTDGTHHWRQYESSLHVQVLHKMKLRTELDQAIANEAFTLYYQPIVDLGSGRAHGVEALVRWQHPTLGMVPPLDFIPLAEESGLIIPLGEWILRTAIAAAARWREATPLDPPSVSVNVSPRQFRAPGFVDRVFDELAASGLPPALLTIEITESLILGEHEYIHADIGRLRQAGVKVAIDDFGTGYSSLSYLDRVPVDSIKLDKSFVDTISTSVQQLNLVRGIIQLTRMLKLDVVAEGIETDNELRLLVDAGCEFGQGYHFARPMPYDEVDRWLRERRAATGPAEIDGVARSRAGS